MKAVGLIVEYNPFHHGHAYHVNKAKEITGAEIAIAAMSGNFLQRGEPALISKWTRTEMALRGGIDLVFELPYTFAVQKADTFANGALSLLSAAECDYICFGSESGNIEAFYQTYNFLKNNKHKYNESVQTFIKLGNSYPKAMSLAYQELGPASNLLDLSKPNNILGFQYVRAAIEKQLPIKMTTITRKDAGYHDEFFASPSIASATSIRKALFTLPEDLSAVQPYIPNQTYDLLLQYREQFGAFHSWDMYWDYLQFILLRTNANQLKAIYEIEEGMENRILSNIKTSQSFTHLMGALKTKRYTWTRLQRVLTHILTGTTKDEMKMLKERVTYLRLLGMTEKGRLYLNRLKKTCPLTIVTKRASFNSPQIDIDSRAAELYTIGLPTNSRQFALQQEYYQKPIYLK
ncbi:nucleotidyltransferase [Niallia sp. XMNu-256]|uniref:nucleotidyltransferase n=1 Tax=Niallia sp. XMNu-256 TaxID=3082444 RepID=UPI0030CB54E1